MKIPDLKRIVRAQATFVRYNDGNLWYQVLAETGKLLSDDDGPFPEVVVFDFPIPISDADADAGDFLRQDKAIRFMPWIENHVETLRAEQAVQAASVPGPFSDG